MESGHDPVQDMNPDAVIPHVVETLLQGILPHDLAPGVGLVEIPGDRGCLGNKAAVGQFKCGRLAPGIHLQVRPLSLLAARRHIVDVFVERIGDSLFMHEQAQALRAR